MENLLEQVLSSLPSLNSDAFTLEQCQATGRTLRTHMPRPTTCSYATIRSSSSLLPRPVGEPMPKCSNVRIRKAPTRKAGAKNTTTTAAASAADEITPQGTTKRKRATNTEDGAVVEPTKRNKRKRTREPAQVENTPLPSRRTTRNRKPILDVDNTADDNKDDDGDKDFEIEDDNNDDGDFTS